MYYTHFHAIPHASYEIIYVDPPWTYKDKALAGHRGAGCKYPLLTEAQLAALPVPQICTPDAICCMWVTYPKLAEGLALMQAWGFRYKTVAFTWVKTPKNFTYLAWLERVMSKGVPYPLALPLMWGMGRWTRANAEIVLLGTRGKPYRVDAGVHQVVIAPVARHSEKPDEVRQRITKLMGGWRTKIELFARGDAADGWDRWGNEPGAASDTCPGERTGVALR